MEGYGEEFESKRSTGRHINNEKGIYVPDEVRTVEVMHQGEHFKLGSRIRR